MRTLNLIRQLRAVRSAPLRAAVKRLVTLGPDLLRGNGKTSALVNITLEVTYRCNIKCEFCFLKDGLLNLRRDELTLSEVAGLADQAKPFGASFFITGGEPFLRRELVEMVRAIKARGLKVGVNTNGLLVNSEVGRQVREAGLDYVIFSLHGPAEIHDCLENRKGAFDLILQNLREFAANKGKTRVMVNCVVAKENAARLSELPPLLEGIEIDGLTYQHETFLTATEVARHEKVWEVLFPGRPLPMVYQSTGYGGRDLEALDGQIEKVEGKREKGGFDFDVFFKPRLRGARLQDWYASDMDVKGSCLYIWTDTRVEPDGTVNACQVMPTPMGNVRETPLSDILNNIIYRDFRAKNRKAGGVFPACARCCKLYRNPMSFKAAAPAWKDWAVDTADSPVHSG